MVLVRTDHKLSRNPKALQRLMHLLGSRDRYVEIILRCHEERRRLDPIDMKEWIRELHPYR